MFIFVFTVITLGGESEKILIWLMSDKAKGFTCNISLRPHVGVPVVAQWLTNPTRNHEVAGSVPALAQWVNDPALP